MPGIRPTDFPPGELSERVKTYLDDLRHEGGTPDSLRDYRSTLRRLCEFYPDLPVGAFDGPEGTRLLQTFMRATFARAKPGTLKKNIAILRSFFKWCEEYEYVGRDPARRLKVPRRHETKHRTPQPIRQVQQLIDAQPETCDRLAIKLAAMLGLRRGAVRGVRLRDFDLEAGTVRVTSKGNKTRTMDFVYPELRLDVETLYAEGWQPEWFLLHPRRRINLPGREGVLPMPEKPLSNTSFQLWWRKRFEICGDVPIHDFHTLRTTAATRLYDKTGHDVKLTQDFLGHASSQTTLDHYIVRDDLELIAGMEKAAWNRENEDEK